MLSLRPRAARLSVLCARPLSVLATAAPAGSSPAPPASLTPTPQFQTTADGTVRFPPSKLHLARLAKQEALRNPPPRPPRVRRTEPRSFALRSSAWKPAVAQPPVREEGGKVHWKVARTVSGHLPMRVMRDREENAKPYIKITEISGDITSLVSELELVVGPLYRVHPNSVSTALEIRSAPQSKVNEALVRRVREWLLQVGV